MWLKWLPWRFVVSRVARARGFIDPIYVLSRMHRFSQPSEVAEPIELVRAGLVFHARGLINSRAIQHNLDWVWPFWVERQFDPTDVAFVPRAFSITHVNLTHRNWTAVGQPDWDWLPIVDPHGLVTPILDGWSVDAWVLPEEGEALVPSRLATVDQQLLLEPELAVRTRAEDESGQHRLESVTQVGIEGGLPVCHTRYEARSTTGGWLALSLRPTNPEGVSFIHEVHFDPEQQRFTVNEEDTVRLDPAPERVCMSHYRAGDVFGQLPEAAPSGHVACEVGLATAAALFRLEADETRTVRVDVPFGESENVEPEAKRRSQVHAGSRTDWATSLNGTCQAALPDERFQFLYDAAVRSLVLHAPGEVYPGPYTYRRFWFRDAAYILEAMLELGMFQRVRRCIDRFPEQQGPRGYFRSQEGEWDSNGEAIWTIERYCQLTGEPLPGALVKPVLKGGRWIGHKRTNATQDAPHAGLMPAGFSAEHLGPNDYYYWDDFWSVAGLESASRLMRTAGDDDHAEAFADDAKDLLATIDRSLETSGHLRHGHPGIPASPYRRMDAGAIGSLAGSYPLRLWDPHDPRMKATIEFLMQRCMVNGGFFQDMIHSGINAYLTLHMAQVMLRAGDGRYMELIRTVADLASPTGQWPEAIHPQTYGGCMGDGQHIWAAAEWVLMIRSLFVREEGDGLVLASGIPQEWLEARARLRLGPTPTPYGPVTVWVEREGERVVVRWEGRWREGAPPIRVQLPGAGAVDVSDPQQDRQVFELGRMRADTAEVSR